VVRKRLWLTPVLALLACSSPAGDDADASAIDAPLDQADAAYPEPRDDLVPAVGTPGAVDIATWNIENFPQLPSTPSIVADLITSMRLDLIAVQEIADVAAFNELVARLRNHDGALSTHTYGDGTYQKIGFIYRSDLITLSNAVLLFDNDGWEFPRPALRATFTIDDGVHPIVEFIAIALHLKAGFGSEDRQRREDANMMLETYVTQLVNSGDDQVLVIGDFNEVLTSSGGLDVFAPWLQPPGDYTVHTMDLANQGGASFIPNGSILDHHVSTSALDDEFAGTAAVIPPLDDQYESYQYAISDHLPVVVSMPVLQ
jgi:endonuclease/exonuclease/phosphatase family metal-dependent hydrolase